MLRRGETFAVSPSAWKVLALNREGWGTFVGPERTGESAATVIKASNQVTLFHGAGALVSQAGL